MADIVFETGLDVVSMQKDLERLRKEIERAKSAYDKKSAGLDADSQALEAQAQQIDQLKQKVTEYRQALEGGFAGGFEKYQEAFTNLPQAEAQLAEMQKSYDKALETNIRLGESTEREAAALEEARQRAEDLARAIAEAQGATNQATEKTLSLGDALRDAQSKSGGLAGNLSRSGTALSNFSRRIGGLVKGALFFSVITSALSRMRSSLTSIIKENEALGASLNDLKGAFNMAAQPIVNVLAPALKLIIDLATRAALAIGNLFAKFSGKSLRDYQKGVKAVGGSRSKKSMASFDTVQTLGSQSGGGASSGSGLDIGKYEKDLDALMAYMSGALLALGLILALSGINIPLGIKLIALGAAGLATEAALNWDSMSDELRNALVTVLEVVGGALLAIGAILTFTGVKIPLGIALMAAGAVSLIAAAAVNWNSQEGFLSKALGALTKIAAGAMLAIGILLLITGVNVPLGIALVAAGAVTIIGAAMINSDAVSNQTKEVVGKILAVAAGALIALGLILICSGFSLPIGIAMLAAGALATYTAAKLNWEDASNRTNNVVQVILKVVSGALLAIGAVLAFSGVGLGLGIALMAAGALTLIVTTVKIDWNAVTRIVSSVLGTLGAIVGAASVVLGILLCLTGAGVGIGLALILAGVAGSVAGVSITDNPITQWVKGVINAVLKIVNWLITQINKISFTVPDWVPLIGGRHVGFNLKSIPYLAQGAVIPPNREFLAVLGDQKSGTNIEAPLDTIVQAFRQVMLESGGQEIEVNFTGSMAQFVAMLDKQITISRRNRGK